MLSNFIRNFFHKVPSNISDNFFKLSNKYLRTNFGINQWFLLYKLKKSTSFTESKYLIPPKDSFWADPHAIEFNGLIFVFFEDYNYKLGKGVISFLSINSSGQVSEPEKILESDFHLSYPYVFKEKSKFFMIPECSASGKIQLYESHDFPYKWKPINTIINDVKAVDTTLFKKDNIWWLFTSFKDDTPVSPSNNLNIFYSEALLSKEWTPHPYNPILSENRNMRSAGKLFRIKNRLFRPSQKSQQRYGQGIHINEVVSLNPNVFEEIKIKTIDSNNFTNISGIHTLSKGNDYLFLDCLKFRHENHFLRSK